MRRWLGGALIAVVLAACSGGAGGAVGTAPEQGAGGGGGGGAGGIPAAYHLDVVKDGRTVFSFTSKELAELAGRQGARGPGPELAAVLHKAGVADADRTLVVEGYTGEKAEIPARRVLEEPESYRLFLTQKGTAKLESAEGSVRHVSRITVR